MTTKLSDMSPLARFWHQMVYRNWPLLTFLQRTWMLLVFTIVSNFLTLWNHVFVWLPTAFDQWGHPVDWRGLTLFDICGAVLYVPALASTAVWVALLCLHLFFRQTLDADAHSGKYVHDWRALEPRDRIYASVILRVGIILAIAIIAASMAH